MQINAGTRRPCAYQKANGWALCRPNGKNRSMSFIVAIAALCFLMLAAYRGFSVILFAPIAALLAVLITEPSYVLPVYSGLFMDKMVIFVKLYFPVFLLGAIFGKVIELFGFSR
jgi:H+/gluconate symporter-like permease